MINYFFIFICIIVLCCNTNIHAQPYHRLLEENKYWDVLEYVGYDNNFYCALGGGARYVIQGDTLLNSQIYKKVYSYGFIDNSSVPYPYFCTPYLVDTIKYLTHKFLREDTTQRKVYLLDQNNSFTCSSNNEILLYDFSYLPGDSIKCLTATWGDCNFQYIVDSIGTEFIYGLNRKVIYFSWGQYKMVEGIGGNYTGGLFQPMLFFEGGYLLDCVNYLGNSGCADFISKISKIENNQNNINVYYDPTIKSIKINSVSKNKNIYLYDLLGIEQLLTTSTDYNIDINVSNMKNGAYILRVDKFCKTIIIY